jgi:hypothetical protein
VAVHASPPATLRGKPAQCTARLEREAHAQAEPAAERQAEAFEGIEIEP